MKVNFLHKVEVGWFVPNQRLKTLINRCISKRHTKIIMVVSHDLFETYLQESFRRCQLQRKSGFRYGQIWLIWLNNVNSDIHWAGLAGKARNPCARSFVKMANKFSLAMRSLRIILIPASKCMDGLWNAN